LIRDGIAKVIPGCHDYNARVQHPGGFYLPNPPRENIYHTASGKANSRLTQSRITNCSRGSLS